MGHVGPEIFSMMGSTDVLIMGVVGGQGSIFGAAIGGGLLAVLLEAMRPVAEYRNLLYAFLLIGVVMFAPKGIWGVVISVLKRQSQQRRVPRVEKDA
jgi:branched-chain amino acid transport system permease protein